MTAAPGDAAVLDIAMLRAGNSHRLADRDPRGHPGFDGTKSDAAQLMSSRARVLADLQERLYACGRSGDRRRVLLILQGMDTSGKGGIVRHVLGQVDPQGVAHASFGRPTAEELSHDFLWRIRGRVPPAGAIGVFDRSHYEDVLVARVHDLVSPDRWRARYAAIREFEQELADAGVVIVKVMLHISADEQRRRLAERLDRPEKHWKFDPSDIDERAYWADYQAAYEAAFDETDVDTAPWYIVPADRKWYARLAVTEVLIDALAGLELQWPPATFDVAAQRARLDAS